MCATLRTIGYEGASLDTFIEALSAANVERVIDVRAVPISRKKGFSKTALGQALSKAGIAYVHLRELGNPKEGRDAARAGRMEEFKAFYLQHLSAPTTQIALDEAVALAAERSSCLLCFERDPDECHRTLIADAMVASGLGSVDHLSVPIGVVEPEAGSAKRAGVAARG